MDRNWLKNKTVIISGASGGIGFNVAKILIEKYDCKVIGICRNKEKMENALSSITKKENFSYYTFDVSLRENWENFATQLQKANIVPDILFNNAGFMLPFKKFDGLTFKEIDEIINTDFVSVINSTKILLPIIIKSKTPAIINVSSAAGLSAVVGESMYCAVKYAVCGFTETLIEEYGKQVYIAGIYPGFIKTNILHRMSVNDKENRLITKLMMPVEKASKKIVLGMKRHKRKIVMGFDGTSMSLFGRLFPRFTHRLTTRILKISKLDLFNQVFDK